MIDNKASLSLQVFQEAFINPFT